MTINNDNHPLDISVLDEGADNDNEQQHIEILESLSDEEEVETKTTLEDVEQMEAEQSSNSTNTDKNNESDKTQEHVEEEKIQTEERINDNSNNDGSDNSTESEELPPGKFDGMHHEVDESNILKSNEDNGRYNMRKRTYNKATNVNIINEWRPQDEFNNRSQM
jgi:hypothetical protein